MKYVIVFSFLFFLWHQKSVAQRPSSLNVTIYNESNGIGSGRVSAMLQATSGYLWFGTSTGLLCYDSYSFRLYNDPAITNTITRLAEDSTHCIWMSFLGGGLAVFNPSTGIFKNYTVRNASDASLMTSEFELLFFDRKGQLWMGITQKGLIKADINRDSFSIYNIVDPKDTFYSPAFRKVYNTLYDIHEDSTGIFWLATHDGLYRFNPKTEEIKPIREKPLQKNTVRRDLFNKIIADKDTLWMCGWGGGISAYNTKTNKWAWYLPDTGKTSNLLQNVIVSMSVKNKQEFWLPYYKGLGIFNKTTRQFYFFNNKDYPNLPPLNLPNVITDKDGNVWSKIKEGLIKLESRNYKFLFTPVEASHKIAENFGIYDMWEDEHLQLIATVYADGLHILNKQTGKKTVRPVDLLPNETQEMHVRYIFKDSRSIFWVVSRDFIYQYDTLNNKLIKITQPPLYSTDRPSNSFTRAAEDKKAISGLLPNVTVYLFIIRQKKNIRITLTIKQILHIISMQLIS